MLTSSTSFLARPPRLYLRALSGSPASLRETNEIRSEGEHREHREHRNETSVSYSRSRGGEAAIQSPQELLGDSEQRRRLLVAISTPVRSTRSNTQFRETPL